MTSTITIGNRTRGDTGEYCGRPSPLGNPWPLKNEAKRDEVCDLYDRYLRTLVRDSDPRVMAELERLYLKWQQDGKLTLLCWCAPKRCHCESIRAVLEQMEAKHE